MRRFMMVLLLLGALVSLNLYQLAAQDQNGASVLQVVDSAPVAGEELDLQAPITVYFDRAIDCGTASSAFSISPAVQGSVACGTGDTSLVFTPAQPYARATAYTITLSAALRGKDGAQLLEPYTLKLMSVGYLKVSQVLPADGTTEVTAASTITVIFNRPVVPLVAAEDMDKLPKPITITPAVDGKGEWLNTSIYVFHPDPALAGATHYNVTVGTDLQATDGSVMQQPFQWAFTTISPALVNITPQEDSVPLKGDPLVQVTFNQPMDRASVEANFYLRPTTQTSGTVAGKFTWADDSTGFGFTPNDLLQLDTVYNAGFGDGALDFSKKTPLTGTKDWSFATVPHPSIISTDPHDGQTDAPPYGGFTVYFASPMDQGTFKDKITIDPKPSRDPDLYYYDYGNSLSVSFPTQPSTQYKVTIAPGMADVYGNTISGTFNFSYTTAAYSPDVSLEVPGPVGFYNAERPKTEVFLKHLNVSQLNLQLYSIPLGDFVVAASGDNYYDPTQNFIPNPQNLLRNWQLDGKTQRENVLKYELLDLGAGGGQGGTAFACDGAMPSRVKVGDVAVVVSDPDPVRARSTPQTGDIVDLLYKGYSLPIVDGPVCADKVTWWQVSLRDGRKAWVAEGVNNEYFIDVSVPSQTTAVDVSSFAQDGKLKPGIYFLTADSPETSQQGYPPKTHFMVVSTANLTVKSSVDSVAVWAVNVQTGQPIANAPIQIYDGGFNVVAQGTTDANGFVMIAAPAVTDLYVPRAVVLKTDNDFGLTLTSWTDGIDPWQFGQNYNYYPQHYSVYMYTDRPIYRPGQPVYFRGIVRSRNDVTYKLPDLKTVPVQITDDQGQVILQKDVALTPFGTFSDTFNLADDAGLGYYGISIQLPSDNPNQTEGGSVGFSVAEFRTPEFQVDVAPDKPEVAQGDTIKVTVDSRYFFGGAVANAKVDYDVIADPFFFTYTGAGYYSFTDYNYDEGPSNFYASGRGQIASGTVTTDSKGMVTIDIPADLGDTKQSQTFTIEATVTDESQQAVSGRVSVTVHQGQVYVGVAPQAYVTTVGQETGVDIIAVDWNSQPIANQNVDVEVVERRWSSVQEKDDQGQTTWTWQVQELPVTTGTVTTDDKGKAQFKFTPPNGGVFKVKVKSHDSAGHEVLSSTELWVSSDQYVSWRQENSNRIDLVGGQQQYSVGDTAEIMITSPFQGTTMALVTVERGSVLKSEVVTMTSNSYVYKLPITADYAPNVYVSVVLVKGVDSTNPVAAFRMGLIQLSVDTNQKELHIEITPDRPQAAPREKVTYTVHVTDYQGNPVAAEVGVGLTDLASLSVAAPNSGPLLSYFYGQQGLSVRTATPLTINTDQITQTTLDTIKGGGGGGGGLGIIEIRGNFVDTPYWNGSLVTDASGNATFDVTLPDNLTTWRLDARAITTGDNGVMLVGQTTSDLISTKPVLIRPVTPRFFVVGDQIVLAAVVNNNTQSDLAVDVALDAKGVSVSSNLIQSFTIPAGRSQRIEWQATVEDVPNVELIFEAKSSDGKYSDASRPTLGQGDNQLLPVFKYEAPETVGTGGVLRTEGSRTESIVLPQRFNVTQGNLTVKVEPSLAATTLDGLDYLQNYPYQCTEQTVSRFLPNVMTIRALKNLGVSDPKLEANLNAQVNYGLQRLYADQKVDGGWGWFVQDDSNPLTTAYALIGLTEAQKSGFPVDDGVIQRAQGFLRTTFITPGLNVETWQLNRQTFVLYALARSGAPDVARTTTMYDSRERLSLYAKAFLTLTLQMIDATDKGRTENLINDLVSKASLSATGAHWDEDFGDYWNWNTNTRTTAIILDALVKQRPDSDLIPNVVRWLMVARTADAWETTQETAWALMSLTDWMQASGELKPNYTFDATLNGKELTSGTATPATVRDAQTLQIQVADLLKDQANKLVFTRSGGDGVLYYTAHMKIYLPVPEIQPLNRGISVERRYTLLGDPSSKPITEAHVGDVVQVRLTIIAPSDLQYVVIEDPIPAGAEAINPNLETSQQIGTQPELNPSDPLSQGWGWWFFSNIEYRDEKVVLYSTYLPAGTYEYVYSIRPGLAGTFNVIPATGQEFYFPEVYGRSAGSTFTILPEQ